MNADRLMTDIRNRLNSLQKAGKSYREMGREAGISHVQIYYIMHGYPIVKRKRRRNVHSGERSVDPRLSTVAALVNYLEVNCDDG